MPGGPASTAHSLLRITTITLDNLVRRIGSRIDLLQMDVQGMEYDILRGGARSFASGSIRQVLIGTHGGKIHRQCLRELTRMGFRILTEDGAPKGQPDGIIAAECMAS
jgi:hypothetical protein